MLVALIVGVILIVGIIVLAISLKPKPEDLVGWTRPEPARYRNRFRVHRKHEQLHSVTAVKLP